MLAWAILDSGRAHGSLFHGVSGALPPLRRFLGTALAAMDSDGSDPVRTTEAGNLLNADACYRPTEGALLSASNTGSFLEYSGVRMRCRPPGARSSWRGKSPRCSRGHASRCPQRDGEHGLRSANPMFRFVHKSVEDPAGTETPCGRFQGADTEQRDRPEEGLSRTSISTTNIAPKLRREGSFLLFCGHSQNKTR